MKNEEKLMYDPSDQLPDSQAKAYFLSQCDHENPIVDSVCDLAYNTMIGKAGHIVYGLVSMTVNLGFTAVSAIDRKVEFLVHEELTKRRTERAFRKKIRFLLQFRGDKDMSRAASFMMRVYEIKDENQREHVMRAVDGSLDTDFSKTVLELSNMEHKLIKRHLNDFAEKHLTLEQ